MNDIRIYLREKKKEVDKLLQAGIKSDLMFNSVKLTKTCQYALTTPGKRLRPIIMQEVYTMLGGNTDEIKNFMVAIEMIHNFSLVHDDLPAIDNDDLRHGVSSTHIKMGESSAILAGDVLLISAIKLACKDYRYIEAAKTLIECTQDMIDGESLDAIDELNSREIIEKMYEYKTSRLLEASFKIGAILANADSTVIEDMKTVGKYLGMAYQLRDDILDVIGNELIIGKRVGSDESNNKKTLLSIYGLKKTQDIIEEYSRKAKNILQNYLPNSKRLIELIDFLINREK